MLITNHRNFGDVVPIMRKAVQAGDPLLTVHLALRPQPRSERPQKPSPLKWGRLLRRVEEAMDRGTPKEGPGVLLPHGLSGRIAHSAGACGSSADPARRQRGH